MKSAPFAYHDPTTIGECLDLLAEHGSSAGPLAGGQSLLPLLAARESRIGHIVDLRRVAGLAGRIVGENGVRVAAMTTQRAVERDHVLRAAAPAFAEAVKLLGPAQVRARGTIGGALACAHPASVLPATAVALDSEIELAGNGPRAVPAEQFFLAAHRTAAKQGQLITGLRMPHWPADGRFAIEQIVPWGARYPLAGAVAALTAGSCRLVLFGLTPAPVRAVAAGLAITEHADPAEAVGDGVRQLSGRMTAVGLRMAEHVLRTVADRVIRNRRLGEE